MPVPSQHSLLCILLVWTTIISIIQAVFIILFFTLGHKELLQNSSITDLTPLKRSQNNFTTSLPSKDKPYSCGGRMLSFKAVNGGSIITWVTRTHVSEIIMANPPTTLTIGKGGYFFLNLQVTLDKCDNPKVKSMVHLSVNKDVILKGWFNTNADRTGSFSKVEMLSTGDRLEVTINPPCSLNNSESFTHLDIIYLPHSR